MNLLKTASSKQIQESWSAVNKNGIHPYLVLDTIGEVVLSVIQNLKTDEEIAEQIPLFVIR